ncbi:hypothetical protein ACW0JT_05475 [Arthrobacter sp. SA17]
MGNWRDKEHRRAIWAGAAGFMAVAAYTVAGSLQVLVWNPLASVPGASLEEIHSKLAQANESLAPALVLAWASIGIMLAAFVLIGTLRRFIAPMKVVLMLDLILLVLAAPTHWYASFPAGMSLADTFSIGGGDHAPWGKVLYLISGLALVAFAGTIVPWGQVRGSQRPAGR